MSYAYSAAVWKLEGLEPIEKLLLLALADHADDSGLCWPSLSTLEERTGLCRTSVCKKLISLEVAGHVTRDKGSLRNSTRYMLRITPVEQFAVRTSPPDALVRETHQGSAPHALGSAPDALEVVRYTHQGSAPHAPESTIESVKTNLPKNRPAGKPAAEGADDLRQANEVTLDMTAPPEVRQLWPEWCSYRTERHSAKGREKLAWTPQAARMSAQSIAKACERHPARVVADRIRTAIEGRWQGLNLDKLDERRGASPTPVNHSGGPRLKVMRGGGL